MRYICTYFDSNFLSRGLTMISSLYAHDKNVTFYVLPIDKKAYDKLSKLNYSFIKLISLKKLFKKYPEIKLQKEKRKINEFCFLLTPFLIDYCICTLKVNHIFYADADLFFFNSCKDISDKLNKFSIISSIHNFSKKNKFQEKINGYFNVGFLGFKKNNTSKKCLNIWKKQCYFSTTLNESFNEIIKGDQLYLNSWPKIFKKNFHAIKDNVFNLGAWNINDHCFYLKNNFIYANKKKVKMVHANFIEIEKNKIIIPRNQNFKLISNLIVKRYQYMSKKIEKKELVIVEQSLLKSFLQIFSLSLFNSIIKYKRIK